MFTESETKMLQNGCVRVEGIGHVDSIEEKTLVIDVAWQVKL